MIRSLPTAVFGSIGQSKMIATGLGRLVHEDSVHGHHLTSSRPHQSDEGERPDRTSPPRSLHVEGWEEEVSATAVGVVENCIEVPQLLNGNDFVL